MSTIVCGHYTVFKYLIHGIITIPSNRLFAARNLSDRPYLESLLITGVKMHVAIAIGFEIESVLVLRNSQNNVHPNLRLRLPILSVQ